MGGHPADHGEPRPRYDASGIEIARRQWRPFCRGMAYSPEDADAGTEEAIAYLQAGLSADAVAALLRIRFGSLDPANRLRLAAERAYCECVRKDMADLLAMGHISADAAAAIDREFQARLAALDTAAEPIRAKAAAAPQAAPAAETRPAAESARLRPSFPRPAEPVAPVKASPSAAPISLRDLFAEHSVLILASLGAFLLVVATVLFELYGTVGLGGGGRLGAVVALNLVFAVAGYLANRQQRLRSVGHIYIALAAVLLPLVGIAAWTFLGLGAHGITVDQALAATAIACGLAYGFLARALGLRAYGEMAGAALLVGSWGLSGAVAGDEWRSVGVALTPVAYAAWQRLVPDRVFSHFEWFAHASALVALGSAARFAPSSWLWTATLATLGAAYIAWQAVAFHPSRAWAGEAALVLAATAASGPLGVRSNHFVLPMLVGIPLLLLARAPGSLGGIGRVYRAHPGHLFLAVVAGLALAAAENVNGEVWPVALALWIAVGLYLADFGLGRSEVSGFALRAALPAALATTGQAWGFGAWTATLTAAALAAYVIPFIAGPALKPLTKNAAIFFYASLVLVVVELQGASVGERDWEIPAAMFVSAGAFAAASVAGAVRFSPYAARGLFTLAWFAGVDALNAQGWRGPFDALLAVVYVGLGHARNLATRTVATAGRRWFVHITALAALALCFTGPEDQMWWRLAAALGALAVAYWWLAITRVEIEMPWLAWAALGSAAAAVVLARVPELWQGTAIVAATVLLTGGWAAARISVNRPSLHATGLPVLGALVLLGAGLSLREAVPTWSQAVAALLAGAFLVAWSILHDKPTELVQSLRAGAAAVGATGLFLGAGVLHLDPGYAGLLAVGVAAAHAEWNIRARGDIERWYALAALLALAPVIYFWPYGKIAAALVAVEFITLAVLCVQAGIRRNQGYLAYPAILLLAPALHIALDALSLNSNVEFEEIAFATLAWVAGVTGLALRTSFPRVWALSTEAGAITLASGSLLAMASNGHADPAGIALLAFAPIVYTGGMQERERWVQPAAALTAYAGAVTLLEAHGADTILYAAALGLLGLIYWVAGRLTVSGLGRHPVVDMHRYLGLGLLAVAGVAGFFFPDKTGQASLGASLAAAALLITAAVMWLDARTFDFRPNWYLALVSAGAAGYFVARGVGLVSWELVPPGLGVIACGILLRRETAFHVDPQVRQLIVGVGLGLVMGWAAVFTVGGDLSWLVALLIEGALTVGAGIVLRSRVLLGGGGGALALVSLRALLSIAQAGYLFAAFGAVAFVLLAVATALALGRERSLAGARGMRELLAQWD